MKNIVESTHKVIILISVIVQVVRGFCRWSGTEIPEQFWPPGSRLHCFEL